jgi:hypothetical protein
MGEKEAIEILMQKGMTYIEAKDFIDGCKRGIKAYKEGDIVHWDDVKKELGLNHSPRNSEVSE